MGTIFGPRLIFKKHIAIFGGAFNPISIGHIETAKFVLKHIPDIDQVWVTPSYQHIFNKEMISAKHRLAICKLALSGLENIVLFPYEIEKKIQCCTLEFAKMLETDKRFKNYYFYFVIGMDNANEIFKWERWQELVKTVRFIIINRPGIERNLDQDWYMKYPHVYLRKTQNLVEVSSTKIRVLVKEFYKTKDIEKTVEIFQELSQCINTNALKYILKNRLYE